MYNHRTPGWGIICSLTAVIAAGVSLPGPSFPSRGRLSLLRGAPVDSHLQLMLSQDEKPKGTDATTHPVPTEVLAGEL